MTSLEWGRLHDVTVEQLEADHGVIANLVVQLDDAIETDQSHDIVSNIVVAIGEFTDHHMQREAAVWARTEALPSPQHVQQHGIIVKTMTALAADLRSGKWTIADELNRIRPVLNAHVSRGDGLATHTPAPSSLAPIVGGFVNGA